MLSIIDLQAKGVSKNNAMTVTDLIRSDLIDSGRFLVIERSQLDIVLKEQGLQQSGCTDNSCAVQLGELLSANKILLGKVNQLDSAVIITVRIVDIEKGLAEFSSSEKSRTMDGLDVTTRQFVDKLIFRIAGEQTIENERGINQADTDQPIDSINEGDENESPVSDNLLMKISVFCLWLLCAAGW